MTRVAPMPFPCPSWMTTVTVAAQAGTAQRSLFDASSLRGSAH